MKKTLIALATLLAIGASATAVMADNDFSPRYGHGMRGGPNAEYMARVLDLTPDQQAKMKALLTEQAERRAQMRASMQAEMQTKLQSILTKEQYAKMTELRHMRQEAHSERMGPGAGSRGPGNGINCTGNGPGPRNAQ